MPVRTNGVPAGAAKRFELPALNFKFNSLTEGTDIPPPLPSPVAEKEPVPKTPVTTTKNGNTVSNGAAGPTADSPESLVTKTTTAGGGTKRPADSDSASSPNRQGSIRRLFSRNLLNHAYEEAGERPASRGNGSIITDSGGNDKKAKRSSGWFSRLRSNHDDGGAPVGKKRATIMVLPTAVESKSSLADDNRAPLGPPPPMIPELSELKSKVDVDDGGSLGGDLFKDIK